MNIVKCNQAHTVFKYNFVVLVNLPFVSVILCLSLSLDGCWSNFHLVYKILFLPVRCNVTVLCKTNQGLINPVAKVFEWCWILGPFLLYLPLSDYLLQFFCFYMKWLNQRALLSGPIHVAVHLALVVERLGNAIHWINFHPLDNAVRFAFSYLLEGNFSVG